MRVVFDLDDTLYKEVDFLKSAYRNIANQVGIPEAYDLMWNTWKSQGDAFAALLNAYHLSMTKEELLDIYRFHRPEITLSEGVREFLECVSEAGMYVGVVTDGRTKTQMNKMEALDILKYIWPEDIVISESFGSEKPNPKNFMHFMKKDKECIYIADNPKKDFLAPNLLGWKTVCLLDDGRNIHKQDFDLPEDYLPQQCIKDFSNVVSILSLL